MRTRPLLAAILGAGLVLGACASDPDGSVSPGPSSPASSATPGPSDVDRTPGQPEPGSTASPSVSSEKEPSESPTRPSTPAPSQPGTGPTTSSSSGGNVPTPVAAGTYRYATDGEYQVGLAQPRPMPSTTTLEAGQPDARDHQLLTRDLRDEDGKGSVTTMDLQFGVEGVVLHSITTLTTIDVFGSDVTNGGTLAAEPPTVIAPVDMQVGFTTKLHLEGGGTEVDGTVTARARETLTIGGQAVETILVDLDFTFSGETEGEQHSTWWIRADDLLVVREESELEATSQGVDYREEHTSQLRSVDPA